MRGETEQTGPDKSGSKPRRERVYLFLEFTIVVIFLRWLLFSSELLCTYLKPNASFLAGCITLGENGARYAAGADRKRKTIERFFRLDIS